MKLTIIIPVHNEETTLEQLLRRVITVPVPEAEKEIIVVNDGSTDRCGEILARMNKQYAFSVITHEGNWGKGEAVKSALEVATGDFVLIQDADLEYDPGDIPRLFTLASFPPNGFARPGDPGIPVYGARGRERHPARGLHFVYGAMFMTWLVNALFKASLSDVYTGYKVIPKDVFKSLNIVSSGFEFEAEVTCKLLIIGCKILEVPIHYQPRNKSQGKHIDWMDGVVGFWTVVKYYVSK